LYKIEGASSPFDIIRAMNDHNGPKVAKLFYKKLFAKDEISVHDIPYALDHAITALRYKGIPPERWTTFIHMGA
jgi:hypothetical protein